MAFKLVAIAATSVLVASKSIPKFTKQLGRERRIVNGADADQGEWPWFVSLRTPGGGSHFCGGSLVAGDVVMTAAHCVVGEAASSLQVNVGSYRLDAADSGIPVSVQSITVHPQYDDQSTTNDIAFLKLSSCVDGVVPIRWDTRSEEELFADGNQGLAAIIGHGTDSSGGNLVNILQEAEQTVLTHAECASLFQQHGGDGSVVFEDTMICGSTTSPNGGSNVDTCQGDSGGPFVTKVGAEYFLTGLTSWGYGCAASTPGVYTRVAQYAGANGFIEQNAASACGTRTPTVSPPPTVPPPPTTDAPTPAPSTPPPNPAYQGSISCGSTVTGSTSGAPNTLPSQSSGEAHFSFSVSSVGEHAFDGCASSYDTWVRIYTDNDGDNSPDANGEVFQCDDCGGCGVRTSFTSGSTQGFSHLTAGNYILVIEGYANSEGQFSMTMGGSACGGEPQTQSPTPSPSPANTPEPETTTLPAATTTTGSSGIVVGRITCGATVAGSTVDGTNLHGNAAADKAYSFAVGPNGASYTFSTCGSGYDTFVRVYAEDWIQLAANDDSCAAACRAS